MPQLTHIYRYPVKSMGGDTLNSADLGPRGIPGDRCWTLKDEERGGIKGGKRFPALMGMHAALDRAPTDGERSPPATITLSDGRQIRSGDSDANTRLTEAVGAPVSLWPLPEDQLDHDRRMPPPAGTDPVAALREVFARTEDEPLPDLSAFPAELMTYEAPPGTYFDAYPLLLMSHASLASMQAAAGESNFDVRRFRPNLLVDTGDSGFPEEAWAGRHVRIGSAELKIEMVCPRCVMTTHGFGDLPKDPKIMRTLVQRNDGNLGVYATVSQPGTVQVGDTLEIA